MAEGLSVLVEGWRGINHSYALVNQYQLIELLKQLDLRLFHFDAPFARANWSRVSNPPGFTAEQQKAIDAIPPPREDVDCVYTIRSPFSPVSRRARLRAVTFMITETGLANDAFAKGELDVASYTDGPNLIQTSSAWSADRLADWGFRREKIVVIPLGVDADAFAPMSSEDRTMSRGTLGVTDETLFFAVSAPFFNKGLDLLLRAFAVLVQKGRNVRLIVKDQKDVYGGSAQEVIRALAPKWPGLFSEDVIARMSFVHGNVAREILRIIYCAADCVVSAYRAEGFNLPVLEAISCGTPVIVTEGGATEDFVSPDVAVKVGGTLQSIEDKARGLIGRFIEPDFDTLVDSMDLFATGRSPLSSQTVAACRDIAHKFSWPATTRLLVDALRDGIAVPFPLSAAGYVGDAARKQ